MAIFMFMLFMPILFIFMPIFIFMFILVMFISMEDVVSDTDDMFICALYAFMFMFAFVLFRLELFGGYRLGLGGILFAYPTPGPAPGK